MLFSIETASFIFPPSVHKGCLFFTSLPALIICYLFDDSHSDRCEAVCHCGFDLHFPPCKVMKNMFSCTCWPSGCFGVFFFLMLNGMSFFAYFLY